MKTDSLNDDGRDGKPSASGVERLVNCAGSPVAEKQCGPMPDSEIADQGSKIHYARMTGDLDGLTDEEIQIYQGLELIESESLSKWRHDLGIPKDAEIRCMREERLWVRDGLLNPLASAKIDVYWKWETFALVIDYKSGFLPTTPSPKNWQLRTAALALFSEDPSLTNIRVAIAQHRFRSRYDACDYTVGDIEDVERDFMHALWRSEQPDAPRNPGYWCKYCRAKANCPQFAALALLPMVKTGPDYPEGLRGKGLTGEIAGRVALMDPQDLAFIYEKRFVMEGIQDAVRARLKLMTLDELKAIGLTFEKNGPMREITDIDGAFNILIREDLLSVDQFHECCKLILGKVEVAVKKRIVEHGKAKTIEGALKYLSTLLSPVTKLNTRADSIVKLEVAPAVPASTIPTETPVTSTQNGNKQEVVYPLKRKIKVKRGKAGTLRRKDSGKARTQ